MKNLIILFSFFLTFSALLGQNLKLDVEGNGKITGDLWLSTTNDLGSIHLGYRAGVGSDQVNSSNTFIGYLAGENNITGKQNSYLGHACGQSDQLGNSNSFFGYGTGQFASGNYNTFFGTYSGWFTEGTFNCFYGSETGQQTKGHNNCFFGHGSGVKNKSGSGNAFYGHVSGLNNVLGSNNTCIGSFSDLKDTAYSNATAIGYMTIVDTSNKVRIGNNEVNVIEGEVPFSSSSDARLKEFIKPVTLGLEFINDLNPVIYHRKNILGEELEMGLIAQGLVKTLHDHGVKNSGMVHQVGQGYMSIRYNDLFAPLIKSIQTLYAENTFLRNEIEELKSMYKELVNRTVKQD